MEVLQRTANRGSISGGGYEIDNSLKLEADNNERMQRASNTIGTPTNAKIATLSFWAKRTELISNNAHFSFIANAGANSTFICFEQDKARVLTTGGNSLMSNALFRDTSAWYHFVAAFDMTQGTASNRVKIYINGVQITSFQTETYGTQNNDIGLYDTNMSHYIGYAGSQGFNGYITELNLIDGQQLAPTEFGETDEDSGIWKPKAYDGTYGNEGYYLDMSNASNLGEDQSGNDNDFGSLYNISAADQATDTPTNNFCTLASPQQFVPSKTASLVKEGGTTMFGGNVQGAYSTMGVRSGKWYFESTLLHSSGVNTENHGFGVIAANRLYEMNIAGEDIGADVGGWSCAGNANPRNNNSGASNANYLTSPAVDVVLGCAIDMDNGKIWWHNAGTWHSLNSTVGNPATGASPAWSNLLTATDDFVLPAAGLYQTGAGIRAMNFGGYALPVFTAVGTYSDSNGHGSFSYAPPTGYYALCTKNLAEYG
tara:strand:+ start:707 stop:2158 length:1452 start_codon:yes stop_codon:yes gene_type:complete